MEMTPTITIMLWLGGYTIMFLVASVKIYNSISVKIRELQLSITDAAKIELIQLKIKELEIRVHKLEGGEKTTNALLRDLLKEFQDFKVDIAKRH